MYGANSDDVKDEEGVEGLETRKDTQHRWYKVPKNAYRSRSLL